MTTIKLKTIATVIMVVFAVGMTTGTTMAAGGATPVANADPSKHFHPKGKMPSGHTIKFFDEALTKFPFSDKQDFEEYEKMT